MAIATFGRLYLISAKLRFEIEANYEKNTNINYM